MKESWIEKYAHTAMLLIIIALMVLSGYVLYIQKSKNIDESKFMMECVYDHFQTPENCKKILNGEDPPKLPFE